MKKRTCLLLCSLFCSVFFVYSSANIQAGDSAESAPLAKAKVGLNLGDAYITPDGMTVAPDKSIILAIPSAIKKAPGYLMRITEDNQLEPYFTLPVHPETGRTCPLGMSFGSDGNLYIADGQGIAGELAHKSRLLRVVHENGVPVRCEVLATGLVQANGLECCGDRVYVNETQFDENLDGTPFKSGVYGFDISEFNPEKPIALVPDAKDKHVVFTFSTDNPEWQVGANGLAFSPDGKMYVANFGEKAIYEVILDKSGKKAVKSRICIQGGPIESVDGIKYCAKRGLIFFADFAGNAVHVGNPVNGKVAVLAKDPLATNVPGDLDRCSEVCIRNGIVYVSNIDLPNAQENGPQHIVSIIDINKIDLVKLLSDK